MSVPLVVALLTVKDFSDRLGLAESTTRKWIASGRVTAVKLGDKAIRIHPDEIGKLIRPRQTKKK